MTGFFTTLSKVVEPVADLTFSLVRQWAIIDENILKVRGTRKFGLTSIKAFFLVLMYTYSRPAKLSGLSSNAIRL